MMQLPRFNIAAVPIDANIHNSFFKVAEGLKDFADGYCLSPYRALPHVTLCQFRAKNESAALALTENFVGIELAIKNVGYYVRKDAAGLNDSIYWSMYAACRDKILMKTQADVYAHLLQAKIELFTQSGADYFPHFTLGRTMQPPPSLDPATLYAAELVDQEIPCRIRLGLSDEMGQFLKILSNSA
jgi:2'-5' RNA ligase